jgi:hypothetical protein
MSEWLKEHAWKPTPPARADAHEIPPTQFGINDFRVLTVEPVTSISLAMYSRTPLDAAATSLNLRVTVDDGDDVKPKTRRCAYCAYEGRTVDLKTVLI